MTDVLEGKKLTYSELVEILAITNVRIDRLEKCLTRFIHDFCVWSEFQTTQILDTKSDVYSYTKKTPWKKLDELEQIVKNFITYKEKNSNGLVDLVETVDLVEMVDLVEIVEMVEKVENSRG